MNSLQTIFRAPAARTIVRRQQFTRSPALSSSVRHSSSPSNGAKPKILDDKPPKPEEQPQEVKEHNEDVDNRTEKTHEVDKSEKVDQEFWKGGEPVAEDGGVDKDA